MFIYSIPIFLVYMHFGSAQEYMIATLFLLLLLYISTPSDPFYKDMKWGRISELTLYQYLFDSWCGQVKLWLIFWPFFIILNIILYTTDSLARAGSFTVSSWDEVHFMLFIPIVFWTICIWRNSLNTRSRYWAIAARFMTLAVFFEFALKLEIRMDYPRIFFQCQELALDYSSCF